jgi:hypothetical protein
MTKRKIFKIGLITFGIGVVVAAGIVLYLFNMPHRDVQASSTDYRVTASELVNEYLTDPEAANNKYLDDEGESGILEVSGLVVSITEDFNDQKVVLLQSPNDKAGVSCTFTAETNHQIEGLTEGQTVVLKGVIRSGASYDEDLEMYEHVILEKCAVVQ